MKQNEFNVLECVEQPADKAGKDSFTLACTPAHPDFEPRIKILICSTGDVLYLPQEDIFVGRDRALCAVVLDSLFVSRKHLRIRKITSNEDRSYEIVDLDSQNGTYLWTNEDNGALWKRISSGETTIVSQGTKIKVADVEIYIL